MSETTMIIPVIMSGGAGTRLWPLSTRATPKQMHPLTSALSLLQETVLRCPQTKGFAPPVLVCAAAHAVQVQQQCAAVNTSPSLVITEPCPRNTAPCAAIAALAVRQLYGDEAQILLLAADHYIADPVAFRAAIADGTAAAASGHIVTFGAQPTAPETGYGYIRKGRALDGAASHVAAFAEKPDLQTAKAYVQSGEYVWNAGIFLCRADVMLAQMQAHRPDILEGAIKAWDTAKQDDICRHLLLDAFSDCPSESIDYAVMESTDKAAVVPLAAGWSDVGSWPALFERTAKDDNGNGCYGRVVTHETKASLLYTDGPLIATLGVEGLAVIATNNAILVTPLENAGAIKPLIAQLDEDDR